MTCKEAKHKKIKKKIDKAKQHKNYCLFSKEDQQIPVANLINICSSLSQQVKL